MSTFWLPQSYYSPIAKHPLSHTFPYLEDWQEKARTAPPFMHEQSGTLLGGDSGAVWMVRTLIALVLNLAASKRLIDPPSPKPDGYDLTRLPVGEFDRVLSWCRDWLDCIEKSTAVLEHTYEARVSEEFLMSAADFAATTAQGEEASLVEGISSLDEQERNAVDKSNDEGAEAGSNLRRSKKQAKSSKAKVAKGKKKVEDEGGIDDAGLMDLVLPEEEDSSGDEDFEKRDQSGSESSDDEDSHMFDDNGEVNLDDQLTLPNHSTRGDKKAKGKPVQLSCSLEF